MGARTLVRETAEELWEALSEAWRESAEGAVRERGLFVAALSGGRTPAGFYRFLARQPGLPWGRTHLFEADERLVPADSPESNQRLIRETLIEGLAQAPGGAHFVRTDPADASAAAADYERRLREFFRGCGAAGVVIDLVLLGVGTDGHTASLFPGSPAVAERSLLVTGVPTTASRVARVTLTLPVINGARRAILIATGAGKRWILRRVLGGEQQLPAALVRTADGPAEIFADRAAAG